MFSFSQLRSFLHSGNPSTPRPRYSRGYPRILAGLGCTGMLISECLALASEDIQLSAYALEENVLRWLNKTWPEVDRSTATCNLIGGGSAQRNRRASTAGFDSEAVFQLLVSIAKLPEISLPTPMQVPPDCATTEVFAYLQATQSTRSSIFPGIQHHLSRYDADHSSEPRNVRARLSVHDSSSRCNSKLEIMAILRRSMERISQEFDQKNLVGSSKWSPPERAQLLACVEPIILPSVNRSATVSCDGLARPGVASGIRLKERAKLQLGRFDSDARACPGSVPLQQYEIAASQVWSFSLPPCGHSSMHSRRCARGSYNPCPTGTTINFEEEEEEELVVGDTLLAQVESTICNSDGSMKRNFRTGLGSIGTERATLVVASRAAEGIQEDVELTAHQLVEYMTSQMLQGTLRSWEVQCELSRLLDACTRSNLPQTSWAPLVIDEGQDVVSSRPADLMLWFWKIKTTAYDDTELRFMCLDLSEEIRPRVYHKLLSLLSDPPALPDEVLHYKLGMGFCAVLPVNWGLHRQWTYICSTLPILLE
ncbi:Serine/threonine-protein kinase tel1 [Puccinia graminis f. sp. tritici]|uniref:Serine/threonine-protein kinase tel1 n=1 Tax=Puccinia graminis f. sp. tritici TaxID=56615 RepID=A0A5B0RJ15_PUCGR|nr:Serine/threonine-protein kinase tel1 [Puccinia graminis f. sp. tritici]